MICNVVHRGGQCYEFKSELLTDAVRFWIANPDYNYGYLFALQHGNVPIVFSSKEAADENLWSNPNNPLPNIRSKRETLRDNYSKAHNYLDTWLTVGAG